MVKPAARQTADKAAHTGPIITGSPNVTIGGLPAARKGDAFVCALHGPGVIIGGSGTVTINGIPAARMGDITRCDTKVPPPTKGKKPPVFHYSTFVKNTNKDGSVKVKNPENMTLSIFRMYSQESDEDGDGSFDQEKIGFSAVDFQQTNPWGDKSGGFGTTDGFSVAKVEGTIGHTDKEGVLGASAKAKATGISANSGISSGKEGTGDYTGAKAEGSVGYGEAKAEGKIFTGGEEKKYGFGYELGAEAAAAHGELEAGFESKYFAAKGALAGSAGSVGAGTGLTGFIDVDDLVIEMKVSGELALLLGLKGDLVVRVGDYESPKQKLERMQGTILSGLPTVLIGG